MSEQLKPCPFCGGKAKLCIDEEAHYGLYVECQSCHATTDKWIPESYWKDSALAAWNQRASDE